MTQEKEETKRLFFGVQVEAPWHDALPDGRMIKASCRHLTLVFLGDVPFSPLQQQLPHLPQPSRLGLVGFFDKCLFLPHSHPRVVAWNVSLLTQKEKLINYQKELSEWLFTQQLLPKKETRPWLAHVTLCRKPFDQKSWKKSFSLLPCMTTQLHLYESVGNLDYQPIWSLPLTPPIEEIDHLADIGFILRAHTLSDLYLHAQIALAFYAPEYLSYLDKEQVPQTLDQLIVLLNEQLAKLDAEQGSAFKAVSYHGALKKREDGLLEWEMIVDV